MVGPAPGAAAAAVEERQRKLQEYLAAKGKLKSQNPKPYLKANNICPKPAPSISTVRPKKDVTDHVALPIKTTRPISLRLQPRPTNVTGAQKPNLNPPKPLGKRRLTAACVSSGLTCKPSSSTQQHLKSASSATRKAARDSVESLLSQKPKTAKPRVTNHGTGERMDSKDSAPTENESSGHFLKERDKENLPQPFSDADRNPAPQCCSPRKPKTNSHGPAHSRAAPKEALGKGLVNKAILKDRGNKQFVGKTQVRSGPVKSQPVSRGATLTRPGGKPPRTVPCHSVKPLSRTLASKKPVAKDQDIQVNGAKHERPNETKLQSCPVNEQKARHTKPRTDTSLFQGGMSSRHLSRKPEQKFVQPWFRPRTPCVLPTARGPSQRPPLTTGRSNAIIPSTPQVRANGSQCNNNFQQKAQTVNTKLKRALPQSQVLSKTAPKMQADCTVRIKRGVANGSQTNPNMKKATEDRRKQLEEWQKSKGKIYKRPPMELKAKRRVIEEMNISFWKSMEEEEKEKKAQCALSSKISSALTECLQLVEGGVFSDEVLTILSSIPEAEKFAKFWICKAKLLAQKGNFDVIGLYEEAIRHGATPILELREVILNILQDPKRTTEGIASDSLRAEDLIKKVESEKACLASREREPVTTATTAGEDKHPGIKLQIAPVPKLIGMPDMQDMKLITPVRRSTRIERAVSRYPEMLQDHDLVVASLDELLEVEDTECFIFRRNEALPVILGFEILDG
ncbi:cytoskeleton-associated protein 2-like [Tenrec ecaudatus]|uniref:cytoskeleton-associated protein 2-like n=1 Tax=Tenrec ecaudatus TaxID=94439 RepID=UPI003F593138